METLRESKIKKNRMTEFKNTVKWALSKENEERPSITPYVAGGAVAGVGLMFALNFITSRSGAPRVNQGAYQMMPPPQYRTMPPMGYQMMRPTPALASPLKPTQ